MAVKRIQDFGERVSVFFETRFNFTTNQQKRAAAAAALWGRRL